MNEVFQKFPHTPHLLWLGDGFPRDDKLLKPSEIAKFLAGEVIVEEKVDGANLGLSLDPDGRVRAQSRGNYLVPGRSHAQWNLLWPWLAERRAILEEGLGAELMLYGEWCYARHTVFYDALPDWFFGFDIFEIATRRFWSVKRRNTWLQERGLLPIPEIKRGRFQLSQIPSLIGNSAFGPVQMEGVYLRREQGGYLQMRAKVVSPVFKQAIEEHWTRRLLVSNRLVMAHV